MSTTKIISCGGGYGQASPIEKLFEMLEDYTLDPTFEGFGNFIDLKPMASRQVGYSVDGGAIYEETGPQYPEIDGAVSFFGNFYDYSFVFNLATNDPALIQYLTNAIRANQARDTYALAKKDLAMWRAERVAQSRARKARA